MFGCILAFFTSRCRCESSIASSVPVFFICLISLLLCFACTRPAIQSVGPLNTSQTAAQDTPVDANDYQLGPEDVIEVSVWKNADLSRTVTVRPDGKISLPLIGDVQVAGNTVVQVTENITQKLGEFYREPPQVTVIVQEVNSYAIYILGEVNKPGKYVVKTGTTFLQAMALAGGLTQFSSGKRVLIRRRLGPNDEKALRLRYKDVVWGKQKNVILKPGDVIVVK